tara:strand:- start:143 stop:448 length:306 start_codon:yes stop_codon:yes gene_type:complete
MKIKMTKTMCGASNNIGSKSMDYMSGITYDMSADWQKIIAQVFIDNDGAELIGETISTKVDSPTEIKRARNLDGTLKSDDKSTPNANEAWEGGKAPQIKKK